MKYNMKNLYENWDFEIFGTSTIDNPINNTILFIEANNYSKLSNLNEKEYCVVVAENGILPDKNNGLYNFFIFTDNPHKEFSRLVKIMGFD